MKLEYSSRAQRDLLYIFSYLDQFSSRGATSVVREIREQVETLLDFPLRGVATDVLGTRRLTIHRYRYFVFYCVEGDTVSVIHIRHTSRRPWRGGDD